MGAAPYTCTQAAGTISAVSSHNLTTEEPTMTTTLRTKLYTVIYCALGTTAFTTLTTPAGADGLSPPSKIVKFDDLNITTAAGAKVLYRRIQTAAVEVCPAQMTYSLRMEQAQRACVDHAIDNAVKKVNSPALTELRFGTPVRLASK
jgi:UrcA family protein